MLQVMATQVLLPEAGQHSRCKQQQQQPQALVVDAATLAAACGMWVKVRPLPSCWNMVFVRQVLAESALQTEK
jgi:hypothetical protein